MPEPQRHTIQRQTIEIVAADAGAAQQLRQQADRLSHSLLAALLDRIFSSVVDQDRVLQLDRLDVDLTISSPDRFEEEFMTGVGHALQGALEKMMAENGLAALEDSAGQAQHTYVRGPGWVEAAAKAPKLSGPVSEGRQGDAGLQRRGRYRAGTGRWEQAKADMLVHFLATGHLPWWAAPQQADQLEDYLREALRDANLSASRLRSLFKAPHSRRRLAFQFGTDTLCDVIAVLAGAAPTAVGHHVTGAMSDMARSLDVRRLPDDLAALFWETVVEAATDPGFSIEGLQPVIQRIVTGIALRPRFDGRRTAASDAAGDASRPPGYRSRAMPFQPGHASHDGLDSYPPKAVAALSTNPEPILDYLEVVGPPPAQAGEAAAKGGSAAAAFLPPYAGSGSEFVAHDRIGQERPGADDIAANPAQAVAIGNAGLVVVWPYLGRFFQALALSDHRGFVDSDAACRGVHLLQYLAFGATGFAEPHLLLNKILCGLPADFPVTRRVRLNRREKKECRTLLQAVIDHWQALKNTTGQGLQTAFLQRFGLLSRTDAGWRLRVERSAYDLLLDRLPWGIAVVRLSWMKQALMVEWQPW